MKESISNTYVFTIILTIVAICSALMVVSMNYSKVFKMKNRIIEIIEKYGEYNNGKVKDEINLFLKNSGYPPYETRGIKCPVGRGTSGTLGDGNNSDAGVEAINNLENYKYCIYKFRTAKGSYYSVVLYMSFDFPIISDFIRLELPMYGDTKVIVDY
ncbi:MAG: hypothetical protein RSB77_01585 [Bacilli bacterium]